MINIWSNLSEKATHSLGVSSITATNFLLTIAIILVLSLLRFLLNRIVIRRVDDTVQRYMSFKIISYSLGFIGIVLIVVIWLSDARGIAAYLGILSAGLAIALQDLLKDLAGWLFITFRRPFTVGDRIQIGEIAGDVIDIRLFQFSILEIGNWVQADQSTGRIIHIPNGLVFKESLANYTLGFNFIWDELPVMVTFESNWEKAKNILQEIAEEFNAVESETAAREIRKAANKYMIYFKNLTPIVWTRVDDCGVTLTMRYLAEPRRRRTIDTKIWEAILKAFSAEDDIDFAYPTIRYYDNISEGKPETGGPVA
ncbi:mechanosensitive ion channel [bacterium]|nr:mechanosensitive ion channel [bacterium]